MKKWQRYWLYFVLIFFSYHLLRDILQDLKIHIFISDIFVKADLSKTPFWYWRVFNTYAFEITELILGGLCLKRKKFGMTGNLTISIALFFLTVWLYYWVVL